MLDQPSPQPRSATHAPGAELSRACTSAIAGNHVAPSSLMNMARFSSAMPSQVSSP